MAVFWSYFRDFVGAQKIEDLSESKFFFAEVFQITSRFVLARKKIGVRCTLRNAIEKQNETNRNFSTFVENFIKAPKSNRLAYKELVSAKQSSPTKSQEKWTVDCSLHCFKTIDWEMDGLQTTFLQH